MPILNSVVLALWHVLYLYSHEWYLYNVSLIPVFCLVYSPVTSDKDCDTTNDRLFGEVTLLSFHNKPIV